MHHEPLNLDMYMYKKTYQISDIGSCTAESETDNDVQRVALQRDYQGSGTLFTGSCAAESCREISYSTFYIQFDET